MIAFAPGCFFGLLFGGVSLGRNFAEYKKMGDEGVLAKRVSMGLTVRRKTAKNLAVRRKNERILAVSRKKN